MQKISFTYIHSHWTNFEQICCHLLPALAVSLLLCALSRHYPHRLLGGSHFVLYKCCILMLSLNLTKPIIKFLDNAKTFWLREQRTKKEREKKGVLYFPFAVHFYYLLLSLYYFHFLLFWASLGDVCWRWSAGSSISNPNLSCAPSHSIWLPSTNFQSLLFFSLPSLSCFISLFISFTCAHI